MKLFILVLTLSTACLAGCSFDASSRPIQPAPTPVVTQQAASYCCASCDVEDEQAVCTGCRRTDAINCADDSQRLLCVTNRVEAPESQTTFRVTCY